jgi:hypothetical protein
MRFSSSRRQTLAASSVRKIILRSHRWVRTINATKVIVDAHKAIERYAGVIALQFGGLRCRDGLRKTGVLIQTNVAMLD